jgi:hypothetical protein
LKNLNPQWNEKFQVKLIKKKVASPGGSSKPNGIEKDESRSNNSSESSELGTIVEQLDESTNGISSTNGIQNNEFLSKFKFKMVVNDYDRLRDDLIGCAKIDLSKLKENV